MPLCVSRITSWESLTAIFLGCFALPLGKIIESREKDARQGDYVASAPTLTFLTGLTTAGAIASPMRSLSSDPDSISPQRCKKANRQICKATQHEAPACLQHTHETPLLESDDMDKAGLQVQGKYSLGCCCTSLQLSDAGVAQRVGKSLRCVSCNSVLHAYNA